MRQHTLHFISSKEATGATIYTVGTNLEGKVLKQQTYQECLP